MTRSVLHWGPAFAWAALIVFLSSQSDLPVSLHGGRDKVAHFGAYFVLGFLLAHGAARVGWSFVWPIAIGFLFGAFDELYQGTVPGRTPAFADWIADAAGVLAGVGLYHLLRRARRPNQTPDRPPGQPPGVSVIE